jgi:hypothetical protein
MKRFALIGIGIALIAISITGCSWETGSEAESWSSSYDWVNFSGLYRATYGAYLVSDYTTILATDGYTETETYSGQGLGGVSIVSASGTLDTSDGPLTLGSVSIIIYTADARVHSTYSDSAVPGVLAGSSGTGTVTTDGGWTIAFTGDSGPVSGGWSATWQIVVYEDGTPATTKPGSTGSIYSFNVEHQGQNLTITDNNGAVYTGKINDMASASGAQNTDITQVGADESGNDKSKYTYYESPLPEDGDIINATFEASGVSAAAMSVKIVGTLKGSVASGVFAGREMNASWIEVGGKTGSINGQTSSIPIPVATDTAAEPAADAAVVPG